MIPDPTFMDFSTWAKAVMLEYPAVEVPFEPTEAAWQRWVLALRNENDQFSDLPDPQNFISWEPYARAACLIIG